MRKINFETFLEVLGVVSICLLSLVVVFQSKALQGALKEYEKGYNKLTCYEYLYNYDDIGTGCEKYFSQDDWYIEMKNNEKRLGN